MGLPMGLPVSTSQQRTCFRSLGSMTATQSAASDSELADSDSVRRPWKRGWLTLRPS